MNYNDCIKTIETALNSKKRNADKYAHFKNALKTLKVKFGMTLSTKYLMDLIDGTPKKKSDKLRDFLKRAGLTEKEKVYRDFKRQDFFISECEKVYYKERTQEEFKTISLLSYELEREELGRNGFFSVGVNGEEVTLKKVNSVNAGEMLRDIVPFKVVRKGRINHTETLKNVLI